MIQKNKTKLTSIDAIEGLCQAAVPLFAKYFELSPHIQQVVRDMCEILLDPNVDKQEREMAITTLVEALFGD